MNRLIRGTCRIVAGEEGSEKAARIRRAAQARYIRLREENRDDGPALRKHTFSRIYPAIAVYESLISEGYAPEEAFRYVREYFQRAAARYAPHLRRVIRTFGLAEKVPGLFMKLSQKSFGTDAGFVYEFPGISGNGAVFDIVRCPYYETCSRYGCPDLTRAFCDGDDAGYGDLGPGLIWGRTETLGRGGDRCDFRLSYNGKKREGRP